MADRFPLIVDSTTGTVKELPSGDNLNLSGSNVVNAGNINASNASVVSISATTFTANVIDSVGDYDLSPIVGITTIFVATSGNDFTGNGTIAAPFATPHRAMSHLRSKSIISSSDGNEPSVFVNVGVGTYNFGVKITNQGTGYFQSMSSAVTGGSGSGAKVGVVTTIGSAGIVTSVVLMNGGTGYSSGDVLGVSTTRGSGLQFTPFHVSSTGEILGTLRTDHPNGSLIEIIGSVSGIKPGFRGNQYYNQAGVGVGSNPGATGTSATWNSDFLGFGRYDTTSPAGAYPNPMVGGRGSTQISKVYNTSIIESYYQSRFYFHNCGGLLTNGSGCRLNKLALMSPDGIGGIHGISGPNNINNTTVHGDHFLSGLLLSGFTNNKLSTMSSIPVQFQRKTNQDYLGGFGSLGPDLVLYNFSYGVWFWGGSSDLGDISIINCDQGVQAQSSAALRLDGAIVLNCSTGIAAHRGGDIEFLRGTSSNHAANGIDILTSSNVVTGRQNIGYSSSFDTQVTIIANNGAQGVVARFNGTYQTNVTAFIYGNSGTQVVASAGSLVAIGSSANVLVASGSTNLLSPSFLTLGTTGEIIIN